MASLPTSDGSTVDAGGVHPAGHFSFFSSDGAQLPSPVEWTPAYVQLPLRELEGSRVWCQGQRLPVLRRELGGEIRTLARWPRLGPGLYRLRCAGLEGEHDQIVRIQPAKISQAAFARLIEDLESRLPASIVLRLHQMGGLAGLEPVRPDELTIDQEILGLRRAVQGPPTGSRPGLARVLRQLAEEHHAVLASTDLWVRRQKARQPAVHRLREMVLRPGNLERLEDREPEWLPRRVIDARVEHTADLYENRLVNSFYREVDLRLRRLSSVLEVLNRPKAAEDVAGLRLELTGARRAAAFLDDVGFLELPPTRLTMVLLRRPPYRAALAGYQELHRRLRITLDDNRLEAPLRELPDLYQVWCTLVLLDQLLEAATQAGFQLVKQRLVRRRRGSCFVRVLPDGRPVLLLRHAQRGLTVKAIPERTYSPGGSPLRSDSRPQRPDLAVEIHDREGSYRVLAFDPKYKLWSEDTKGGFEGRPQKSDIDRMHAYRDAIRDVEGERVVAHASILYPGSTEEYPVGISAFRALPGDRDQLGETLRHLFSGTLGNSRRLGSRGPSVGAAAGMAPE